MKFPYSSLIASDPSSSDFVILRRPEIPITIIGPAGWVTCLGLVDTGSDNTIFPKTLADYLHIRLNEETTSSATSFGGSRVDLEIGEVELRIEANGESFRWRTPVSFFDFASHDEEMVILGHAGFLDYFLAAFDGKLSDVSLAASDEMPMIE